MLTLSRRCEYALMALCHLAQGDAGRVVSAREMASANGLPAALLMNLMKELNRAGLVRSVRGVRGGYGLADDPAAISLGRLVRTIDGPVRFVPCAEVELEEDSGCALRCRCSIREPLLRVHERLRSFLDSVTIADLVGSGSRNPVVLSKSAAENGKLNYEATNLSR